MKLLKKIAVGASVFVLTAVLSAGAGKTADASSLKDNITLDLGKQTIKIAKSDDKKVVVSYPTANSKGVLGTDRNVCTYDVGTSDIIVDLSTLSSIKDNYIKIVGNKNTDPVVIKIPATETLGKATVNAASGEITVAKKNSTEVYDKTKLEFATANTNWAPFTDMNPGSYLQLGATIRIRIAPSTNVSLGDKKEITDTTKTTYDLYEVNGNLAGKEIKARINKRASAPKARVDYTKRTITISKGYEYRINKDDSLGEWKPVREKSFVLEGGKKFEDGTILDLTKAGAIDIRKAATERVPASMYSTVSYNPIFTFGVKNDTADKASLVTTAGAVTAGTATGCGVTASYTITPSKEKTPAYAVVTIKNESKVYSYQYVTVDKGTIPELNTKGVKTLSVSKTTPKEVRISFKGSTSFKDKEIYIRRAAVTTGNAEWVSDWCKLATITDNCGKVTLG